MTYGFDQIHRGEITLSVVALEGNYSIDGKVSPEINLFVGNSYRFELDPNTMAEKTFYLSSTENHQPSKYFGEILSGVRSIPPTDFFKPSIDTPEKIWYREANSAIIVALFIQD